ncbi:MAG: hypothetical protein KDB23_03340, partial [Planctomycetales bacterium]|nr:hypothetical protein [Planctomycetales bacterium]
AGDLGGARQSFCEGGAQGIEMSAHLDWGQQIAKQLAASDMSVRVSALRQWEQWTQQHPGPRVWHRDDSIVKSCPRVEPIVVAGQDEGNTLFRAAPDAPLILEVQGPAQLQFDVYLLHPAHEDEAIDDWFSIEALGRRWVLPLHGSRHSQTLTMPGDPAWMPGSKRTCTISVGPGRHKLSLAGEGHSVLVSTSVEQTPLRIPVLPPLVPENVDRVLNGCWQDGTGPALARRGDKEVAYWWIAADAADLKAQRRCEPLVINSDARPSESPPLVEQLHANWRRGMLSREGAMQLLSTPFPTENALTADELAEVMAMAGTPPTPKPAPHPAQSSDRAESLRLAVLLQHWQVDELLRSEVPRDETVRRQLATNLCYFVDRQVPQVRECLVKLVGLQSTDDPDQVIDQLVEHVSRRGEWLLFREVSDSAGTHAAATSKPRPNNASSLTRYALSQVSIGTAQVPDYILSNYRQVTLRLDGAESVPLVLGLLKPQVLSQASPTLDVEIQLDQESPQTVKLDVADQMVQLPLVVPAGSHQVQVRLLNPFAGRYVFLYINEQQADGLLVAWDKQVDVDESERTYHVAKRDRPVKFFADGPTWLRVEQFDGGNLHRRDLVVQSGRQEMTLSVATGDDHTLYRISEFKFGSGDVTPPLYRAGIASPPQRFRWLTGTSTRGTCLPPLARQVEPQTQLVSWGPLELSSLRPADEPAHLIGNVDAIPLGQQEDGTWGIGVGAFQRRAVEEGLLGGSAERFQQTMISYEQFDPWRDRYRRVQGYLRLRDASSPSFGVVYDGWRSLASLFDGDSTQNDTPETLIEHWTEKWHVHNSFFGYAQTPVDPLPGYDASAEGAFGGRLALSRRIQFARRWYHLPQLAYSARWLSIDETSYLPGRVDQDIFTPFKSTHRTSLQLSDTFAFEPSAARRFWFRPSLYSNEDLNPFAPDHASLQTGVSALWRQMEIDVSYRYARFFSDGDRLVASDQHLLSLDTTLDRWQHAGSRYSLDINVRHILDRGDTSAYVTITHFLSAGRGYRDRAPSETRFKRERERRVFPLWAEREPR